MRVSVQLREAINHTLQQTTADLEAQWRATNYAFRKRLHEMEQARQELEWQQKNVSPNSSHLGTTLMSVSHLVRTPLASFPASHL